MDEIQGRVLKQSRRGAVSRLLHAKNDKESIVTWKSDLNRILHVFNVRSVASVWLRLTIRSQTELSVNTHVVVSDIRQDVVNTQAIVSNVQDGVVNTHSLVSELHHNVATTHATVTGTHTTVTDTHTIVSDIHRAMVVSQGGTDGKALSVSVSCIRSTAQLALIVA